MLRPPRFLLRENALVKLLKSSKPGYTVEIGHGSGAFLVTLGKLGFHGLGFDPSDKARLNAKHTLIQNKITSFKIVDAIGESDGFDYIFALEVVGYFKDVQSELKNLSKHLKQNGQMILSFVKASSGYQSQVTGNMLTFSKNEFFTITQKAGLQVVGCRNYGYPLANMIVPITNFMHSVLQKRKAKNASRDVGETDILNMGRGSLLLELFINKLTMSPFFLMQSWFKNTEFGNGFVVILERVK